ncbi:6578_t:CDS:2 [Funneliformis geosporum]|uniref:6578_t:CDS:1 n=1 Tax=Funneliformis geosporum TaxID=1117311 RepID=A0A9W4WU02_9GLOM|nr:6578_t:CDS:2 [Funneliformis geosporum]
MADIEEIIDLYAEIPSYHERYSGLLKQLPPSIINEAWKRLTTRKRNPLSAIDGSCEESYMDTRTQTRTTDFLDKVDKATQTEEA